MQPTVCMLPECPSCPPADDEVGANGKRVKKRGKGAAKRKLRVSLLDRRGPKTLARLLEEVRGDVHAVNKWVVPHTCTCWM